MRWNDDFDLDADFTLGVQNLKNQTGAEVKWGSAATHTGTIIAQFPNDTSSTTAYKIYYLDTSTNWQLASKSALASSFGPLGFALGSSGTTQGFVLHGIVRTNATVPITVGNPLYLNTSGNITASVPTSGYVRLIGYMYFTNTIYFCPDNTFIEIQ